MTLEEYQAAVDMFDCHPEDAKLYAHALGLCEEAGEVAGKLCKAHRKQAEHDRDDLIMELGDVIWRTVALCNFLEVSMRDVMKANFDKLTARKAAGTIIGEGDHR